MGLQGVFALQSFHFLHILFTDAAISQSMLGMENCYDYGSFPDSPFCSPIVLVFFHRPISLLLIECYPHCRIDHTQYYFICRGALAVYCKSFPPVSILSCDSANTYLLVCIRPS
jgi:hypothetical protein